MKKLMRLDWIRVNFSVVMLPALVIALSCASADEIDEALEIERITNEGSAMMKRNIGRDVSRGTQEQAIVLALQRKEMELIRVKKRIARLQDTVKRIGRTSKREESTLHYNLGCMYKAAGQYRQAEAKFLKAIDINPSDAAAHYNLGILYDDDLKEKANARKHYKTFLELSPHNKDAPRVHEWLDSLL